jgi:hypothetical protein
MQIPITAVNPGPSGGLICANLGAPTDPANKNVCDYGVNSIAPTNTNTTTTGKPAFKTGQRVLTFAAKFYF